MFSGMDQDDVVLALWTNIKYRVAVGTRRRSCGRGKPRMTVPCDPGCMQ
jgi:hypothetical protein